MGVFETGGIILVGVQLVTLGHKWNWKILKKRKLPNLFYEQ